MLDTGAVDNEPGVRFRYHYYDSSGTGWNWYVVLDDVELRSDGWPSASAVTGLTDYGAACTIDGVTVMADSIHVNSVEVGYYEYDRWTDQQYLRPTYIINATLNPGTPQANDYTIHIDAVGSPLVASIENPAEGSWFSQGSPVSLVASAANGTGPYSFEWSSDIDGVLGTGALLEWSGLSVVQKGWTVGEHTITVTATDSAGARSSASIGLGICPGTWYADADGDGYGDPWASGTICPPTVPVITTVGDDCDDTDNATHPGAAPNDDTLACMKDSDLDDWGDPSPPPGVTPGTDCDDTDNATHPGADEINDGLDNQCPGEPGHGVIDETSGNSGFHNPTDKTEYSWPPQTGATSYEVRRSELPDMSFACATWETTDSFINDSGEPTPGGVLHYLNRPTEPNPGSWGQDSTGAERVTVCP